ncbi:hypothetical protein ABS71_17660 [bacterium SCN 62-11]|nr:prepilin-type N-terminal cleavage/methylation domain-containing protein [Candidatus Eremiobacteraeota bacterium]ODT59797.1 MAG: hypothetical protein ABS71_17660 [bacterium SCN 62-11]
MRRRGFTLVELLVSITVLAGLSLMLTQLFMQLSGSIDQGIAKVGLQRKAREVLARVAPYLSSAAPINATMPAVYYVTAPSYDVGSDFGGRSYLRSGTGTDKRYQDSFVLFSTTEDYLQAGYDATRGASPVNLGTAQNPLSSVVWQPASPRPYSFPQPKFYGLEWQGNARRLVLRRYTQPASAASPLALAAARAANAGNPLQRLDWVADPNDIPLVLTRSDNASAQLTGVRSANVLDEVNLEFVRFEIVGGGSYRVRVEVSQRIRDGRRSLQDNNAASYLALEEIVYCPCYLRP